MKIIQTKGFACKVNFKHVLLMTLTLRVAYLNVRAIANNQNIEYRHNKKEGGKEK